MEHKKATLSVPAHGHVIASEKWRNSSLIQSLKGKKKSEIWIYCITPDKYLKRVSFFFFYLDENPFSSEISHILVEKANDSGI